MDGLPSQCLTNFLPTSGFMLESGKGIFGNNFYWNSKQKMLAKGFFCLLGNCSWGFFTGFDLNANLRKGCCMVDLNLILCDVREVLENGVHGARMQVDTSNDYHVI